jgi:hypothetical protein
MFAGDIDDADDGEYNESPSRSFMETSFFTHLRSLQSPILRKIDSDDDTVQAHNTGDDTDDHDIDDSTTPAMVRSWNNGIERFRFPILVAIMTILWPTGYLSFHAFQKYTDSTFHPVAGSPSRAAADAFRARYSDDDFNDPMHPALILVLTSATDKNYSLTDNRYRRDGNHSVPLSPAYAAARNFSLSLSDALAA